MFLLCSDPYWQGRQKHFWQNCYPCKCIYSPSCDNFSEPKSTFFVNKKHDRFPSSFPLKCLETVTGWLHFCLFCLLAFGFCILGSCEDSISISRLIWKTEESHCITQDPWCSRPVVLRPPDRLLATSNRDRSCH